MRVRPWVAAHLVLAAVAWGIATRGGTSGRDLLVTVALVAGAFLVVGGGRSVGRTGAPLAPWLAVVLLEAWLLVNGPLRFGVDATTSRLPLLVLAALLTVTVVRSLDAVEREPLWHGLVVLGTVHAGFAIAEAVAYLAAGHPLTPEVRADGLLGNANGLGIFLVSTAAITARQLVHRSARWQAPALVVHGVAILLTGSRLAILAGIAVTVGSMVRATTRLRLLVMPWVLVGLAVVAVRFAHAPPARLHLWLTGVQHIAENPLAGHGPVARVIEIPVAGAPLTTNLHNEPLQLALEYGLIGVGLVVAAIVLPVISAGHRPLEEAWLAVAAACLLASALSDFTLRITPIVVTLASLAAAVLPGRARSGGAWRCDQRYLRTQWHEGSRVASRRRDIPTAIGAQLTGSPDQGPESHRVSVPRPGAVPPGARGRRT